MKFNEKLIKLREINNYSQEEIANYLGVGQTTYSRYENLKTYPDIFIIKKLAKLYQISIDDLVDDIDNELITIQLTNEEIKTLENISKKISQQKSIKNSNIAVVIGNNNKINQTKK